MSIPIEMSEEQMKHYGLICKRHKFTVPVEWSYVYVRPEPLLANWVDHAPDNKVVTKLRCEHCPQEVDRAE